jgi:xanthine dehydrogenase accessory factor
MDNETSDLCRSGDDILAIAARLRVSKQPFALATVIETEGSTSAGIGAKAIFDSKGGVVAGWVGGGCAESTVAYAALGCLRTGAPEIVALDLNDEVLGTGMPCGGSMKVFVDPILPRPILWILGHGRIAECLCRIGALMGLDVIVDDPLADRAHFPEALQLLVDDSDYDAIRPEASDFVVVATQHNGDHQSMRRILASNVRHVALIASHKRANLVLDYLRNDGIGESILNRVRAPAGLDLGAQTPEEIAISVISEIVLLRRRGAGFTLVREKEVTKLIPMMNVVAEAEGHRAEPMRASRATTAVTEPNELAIRAAS